MITADPNLAEFQLRYNAQSRSAVRVSCLCLLYTLRKNLSGS